MTNIRRLKMCMCVVVGMIVLSGAAAQGKTTHRYESQITAIPHLGPNKEEVANSGQLGIAEAITVDSGNLYVEETGRLDKFQDESALTSDPFLSQLPAQGAVADLDYGVALGSSTGEPEMYVGARAASGLESSVVAVFGSGSCSFLGCTSLQSVWNGSDTPSGSFAEVAGSVVGEVRDVAVDHSAAATDWAQGDVFVATHSKFTGSDPQFNVVDIFHPKVDGGEEYMTELTGRSPSEPFSGPEEVAVSGFNGDVVVVDAQSNGLEAKAYLFEPTGSDEYLFVKELASPEGPFAKGANAVTIDGGNDGSVDDGDIYIAGSALKNGIQKPAVYEFASNGEYIGKFTGEEEVVPGEGPPETEHRFARVESLAVDPVSHRIFVDDYNEEEHVGALDEFSANLTTPEVVTEAAQGVKLIKSRSEGTPHTWQATLAGTVDPENAGAATCWFAWGTSPALGRIQPCSGMGANNQDPIPNGATPVVVQATIAELEPGTTFYYRLEARNSEGINFSEESQDQQVTTPGPTLRGESTSAVSSSSATFEGSINPNHEATSYRFEYDTQAYSVGEGAHGVSVPAKNLPLGSGSGEVMVTQHVQGLFPGTRYHYRLVAVASLEGGGSEEYDGADRVFTTQGSGGSQALPDGRAWELVSPPDKHGGLIFGLIKPINLMAPTQASAEGRAVTYASLAPSEDEPNGYSGAVQVMSTRNSGQAGWHSDDIATMHDAPTALEQTPEYQFFSESLEYGLVDSSGRDKTLLSNEASEAIPYLRQDFCTASEIGECYEPLVTSKEGKDRDIGPETRFGGKVDFLGASPDLRHIILKSAVALSNQAPEGLEELYEWSAGSPPSLQLVSVLPADEGGGPLTTQVGLGNKPTERWSSGMRVVSNDGSRVFWSTGDTNGAQLYVRDTASGKTARLDVLQAGGAGGKTDAVFEVASADGSRAYFSDSERLTADSSRHGADLYECRFVEEAGELKCVLTDLTPESIRGGSSEVQNLVLGASEDGSYVYFVANGILGRAPAGVARGNCKANSSALAACNLYVDHDGEIVYIATLSSEDEFDWAGSGGAYHTVGNLTARVSSNGLYATFMSDRSLTGYDNSDLRSDMPDQEVFLYNAATGGLACVSCDPSGARPEGVEVGAVTGGGEADLAAVASAVGGAYKSQSWVAANIPTGTHIGTFEESLYLSRSLTDDGRLFFDSSDSLVPLDVNGQEDVYEYEPLGVSECTGASPGYSESSGGCIGLISSGTSASESGFLDASASGNDVFFVTSESLVPEDGDSAVDVYDAHVCTTSEPCTGASVAPPPCTTADACRAPVSPQPLIYGAPSSASFSGLGNEPSSANTVASRGATRAQQLSQALRSCRKKRRKGQRIKCERRARKRYGAKPSTVTGARQVKHRASRKIGG
jgi:hypothetical protein